MRMNCFYWFCVVRSPVEVVFTVNRKTELSTLRGKNANPTSLGVVGEKCKLNLADAYFFNKTSSLKGHLFRKTLSDGEGKH